MTITEADRENAELISTAWEASGQGYGALDDLIAAALAEERERARAPFLALADEYALIPRLDHDMTRLIVRKVADRIRRAASE